MDSILPMSSLFQAMRHHPCLQAGGGSGLELCQLLQQGWGPWASLGFAGGTPYC